MTYDFLHNPEGKIVELGGYTGKIPVVRFTLKHSP
jgi:hypothetical protein